MNPFQKVLFFTLNNQKKEINAQWIKSSLLTFLLPPILQFEPFEPDALSELESSLLDDHQKIEIKKIPDEQIPNDRSGNWTIKDFVIGIVIEAIAQTLARFASQFLTIP